MRCIPTSMGQKSKLPISTVAVYKEKQRGLRMVFGLLAVIEAMCFPVSVVQASPENRKEYEKVYISSDFSKKPAKAVYSLNIPGDGNCFFWAVLLLLEMQLQAQKYASEGPDHPLYMSEIGDWQVELMRTQLAEAAWACVLWLRSQVYLIAEAVLSEEQESLVKKLCVLQGVEKNEDKKRSFIEETVQSLCQRANELRRKECKEILANATKEEVEELYKEDYGGDKNPSTIDKGDVEKVFAMGTDFITDLLPLVGAVDSYGLSSGIYGIRILERLITENSNASDWIIGNEWNVQQAKIILDLMFTGAHFHPLTIYPDVRTFSQKKDSDVPRKNGDNQLDREQFLEFEEMLEEGTMDTKKPLTEDRIRELHENYVEFQR